MSFTVHGRVGERDVTLTYDSGRLSGDDELVRRTREVLDSNDEMQLTPQDPERPATTDNPFAVVAAVQEVVDEITSMEGDYPMPEADSSAS